MLPGCVLAGMKMLPALSAECCQIWQHNLSFVLTWHLPGSVMVGSKG